MINILNRKESKDFTFKVKRIFSIFIIPILIMLIIGITIFFATSFSYKMSLTDFVLKSTDILFNCMIVGTLIGLFLSLMVLYIDYKSNIEED